MSKISQGLVFVAPHSHFDPEWTKTYTQYLRIETKNLRQRLDLLRDDPSHCFCPPEEIATLPFLKRCGAKYRAAFRLGVQKGQIEVKGAIAPGELTMHQGESIARQFVLGKYLIEGALGLRLDLPVAQSIDNYGLSPQLPQILDQCDRRYLLVGLYQMFNSETVHIYDPTTNRVELWWRGSDGSRVLLMLSRPNYGGLGPKPTEKSAREVLQTLMPRSSRRAMFAFAGADFAAPDPHLPEKIREWSGSKGFPKMKLALPRDYFEAVRGDRSIPTGRTDAITDHLGAFESRVKARQAGRRSENMLLTAERFATAAASLGWKYPHQQLNDAWFQLLMNQDHDPALACLRDSFMKTVMRRHHYVQQTADAIVNRAMRCIGGKADTRAGAGQPWIVFNSLSWVRSDLVSIELNGSVQSEHLRVTDSTGKPLRSHVRRKGRKTVVTFLAENVPSLGYKTFYIQLDTPGDDEDASFEFPYRVESSEDGSVRILRASLPHDCVALLQPPQIQEDHGCANLIRLGDKSDELRVVSRHEYSLGALSKGHRAEFRFRQSTIVQDLVMHRGIDRIDVKMTVQWRDKGFRVRVAVPAPASQSAFLCHEPFMVNRREPDSPTARKPVLYWGGWYDPQHKRGVALVNRGTHSYALEDKTLYMTLFRSVDMAYAVPDQAIPSRDKDCLWCMIDHSNEMASEWGRNEFHYALLPFSGGVESARVHQRAYEFNYPLLTARSKRHGGRLPVEFSFVTLSDDSVILSTWKKAYRGSHDVLRFYEPYGRNVRGVRARLGIGKCFGECNMDERVLRRHGASRNVSLDFAPYKVKSFLTRRT